MIKVDKYIIDASVEDILKKLLAELEIRGIDYLRILKRNNNNIQTCCPYHNDGKEQRPSSGITVEDKGNVEAGTFHCFACGKTASLSELIAHCFGSNDAKVGSDWILDNFSSFRSVARKDELINALSSIFQARTEQKSNYISEQELDEYRYIHPYMYKRKLTDEIIEYFDVGYDSKTDCITFPCNDIDGNCLFIARRSTKTKFFNYPESVDKPVYALDKIPDDATYVIICESIINALTLWSWGYYAVALLGTGSENQYKILNKFKCRHYITAFDGDNAGDNATIRFRKNIKNKVIETLIIPRGKDVNDLTLEEFKQLERRGI